MLARAMTLPSEDRERLLLALRRVDPSGFREQVRAVLLAHEALTSAARALRVPPPTLAAWIAADPSLAADLQLDP
jgi:hypothetical protein